MASIFNRAETALMDRSTAGGSRGYGDPTSKQVYNEFLQNAKGNYRTGQVADPSKPVSSQARK